MIPSTLSQTHRPRREDIHKAGVKVPPLIQRLTKQRDKCQETSPTGTDSSLYSNLATILNQQYIHVSILTKDVCSVISFYHLSKNVGECWSPGISKFTVTRQCNRKVLGLISSRLQQISMGYLKKICKNVSSQEQVRIL